MMQVQALEATETAAIEPAFRLTKAQAYYALVVLTLVSIVNYIDRNVLSILAESVKADLHLTDTQLGFLLGTSFATLFAVVGIPMGRITDQVNRKGLMAVALAVWSSMTALSGLASTFAPLAFARTLVGVGEASANPCSHSLLSDIFPRRSRAGALSTYLAGSQAGAALSLVIGGLVLTGWPHIVQAHPAFAGIRAWQAAFFIVGLPGLILAVLVALIREPARSNVPPRGWPQLFATEFSASVPPFTLITLARAGGAKGLIGNLSLAAVVVAGAGLLVWITGDISQWVCVAIGTYSVGSWIQGLRWRDPELFKVTFGSSMFRLLLIGASLSSCINATVVIWAAPYAIRVLKLSPRQAGLEIGLTMSLFASVGTIVGGLVIDRWKRVDSRAPIWVTLICMLGAVPGAAFMYLMKDPTYFFIGLIIQGAMASSWSGGGAALIQDLVEPRMRGTAAAVFALMLTLVLLAIGPYWAGKVSTLTHSLGIGVASVHILAPIATIFLILAARKLGKHRFLDAADAR